MLKIRIIFHQFMNLSFYLPFFICNSFTLLFRFGIKLHTPFLQILLYLRCPVKRLIICCKKKVICKEWDSLICANTDGTRIYINVFSSINVKPICCDCYENEIFRGLWVIRARENTVLNFHRLLPYILLSSKYLFRHYYGDRLNTSHAVPM